MGIENQSEPVGKSVNGGSGRWKRHGKKCAWRGLVMLYYRDRCND